MIPRLTAALLAACLLLAVSFGIAAAHADLVESDPADGGTIQTPALLTAIFNEELDPDASSLVVRNAAGDEVASGSVDAEDASRMVVELPDVPPGDYSARWTAVTPDDQGVTRGTITFSVASPDPSPSPSPPPIDGEPTAGTTNVLLALVLAGAVVGSLAIYLLRRR